MSQIIECVPNFSEGRDMAVIRQITDAIESVDGVALLDVDPGQATNRTVVTFAGEPMQVVEAAVRAAEKAAKLIDMRQHRGEHPRFGAMDVCPLVPVSGISIEETASYAQQLAKRLGEELGLTIFCYEHAATSDDRQNLANVRSGEYEGLEDKLAKPEWQPDYGPAKVNLRSGATAVGAREFLIAYNVNLNTTSTRRANAVAFDVREKGRIKRTGDPLTGEIIRDDKGAPVHIPGSLKAVKAIGWFIDEYGIAQISMNLTDLNQTPLHTAFDEVCIKAEARGMRVTGSELVGLVPLGALLDAGRHYLRRQKRSLGVPDHEIIKIAVRSLGLDDLKPFEPKEKMIEYNLAAQEAEVSLLADQPLTEFVQSVASEAPAPGGGSVAAAVGALGSALGTMVANLSAHKRGWDDRWEEFSDWAEQGKAIYEELLGLVDEDTAAFDAILASFRLPQSSEAERAARHQAIQQATKRAIEVPFQVMQASVKSMKILEVMAMEGNPASVSDAGVGALCARAAARGAYMNMQINSGDLEDKDAVEDLLTRGKALEEEAAALESTILQIVSDKF